jgi:serine/threonine-protein kinase haspin
MFANDSSCCDCGPYLANIPTELETFRGGFKKVPLDLQRSESILRPSKSKENTDYSPDTTTGSVDSPLSKSFKPIQKYVGTLSCSCDCHLNSIFSTCGQIKPIPIRLITNPLVKLRKIGEGAFGEVYIGHFNANIPPRIFKIVAIEGKKFVNDQRQRRFEEIEPEIIVCQYLNKLRTGYKGCYTDGFVILHHARICRGKYPKKLMNAWKSFKYHAGCENTKPDYPENQLYAIFEHDFSGTDICSFHFKNHRQSLSIILQVAHSLAVAEIACEFEHRDLHWGNVLIKPTDNFYNVYTIKEKSFRIPCCGLTSTIIDFSNSRITAEDNEKIFFDLSNDDEQFIDGPDKVQFDVYKRMKRMTRNKWQKYTPKSNVLWIHYLTAKFLKGASYTDLSSDDHYEFTTDLRKIRAGVLKYKSCTECAEKFLPDFVTHLDTYKCEH